MKPRVPRTFAAAITRIKRRLDDEQCAALVERSPSLIRKWTDPDLDVWPSLAQAVVLDAAYVDGGWGDPPILEAYRDALEKISEEPPALPVDIVHATLSLQAAVGDLSEAIADSRGSNSPGGADITSRERQAIVTLIERLEEKLDTIEDAVVDQAPG
jgi:hypothetical protein